MAEKLIGAVQFIPRSTFSKEDPGDDTFVDRLSNRVTVIILVVFALVVGTTHYVGNPIHCWVPVHFTGSHTKYTNSYCWVRNTYFLPFEEHIPKEHEEDKRRTLTYYQWIPFILLGQALLFYLPCNLWRALNSKAGVDANDILSFAGGLQETKKADERGDCLKLLAKQIDRFLGSRKDYDSEASRFTVSFKHCISSTICRCCGKKFGNYLCVLFLMVKVLYIGNIFLQMFALNSILGGAYNLYGFDMLKALTQQHSWESHPLFFPRVTMCDFNIRRLGNIHRYTVQCVLPINLYTEKMYLFFWFWLIVLQIFTLIDFFSWLMRFILRRDRYSYVSNHLRSLSRLDKPEDQVLLDRFVDDYLKADGVFILRLIGHNTNMLIATEILSAVWDNWKAKASRSLLDRGEEKDSFELS